MTTEQKLEQIVDRLLVKTQDNHCEWKKVESKKFSLRMSIGTLYLYWDYIIGGDESIILDVFSNANADIRVAYLRVIKTETNSNLVRLYDAVTINHQNYVDDYLGKVIAEIERIGDKSF